MPLLLSFIVFLQTDSIVTTTFPEYGIRVQFPKIVTTSDNVFYISGVVSLTEHKVDSVRKDFDTFIARGGELTGDAEEPETVRDFNKRMNYFQQDNVGPFFQEFIVVNGKRFGLRRHRSEPCGCYIGESYTFIDSVRIGIFFYTYADSLVNKIQKKIPFPTHNPVDEQPDSLLRGVKRRHPRRESEPAKYFRNVREAVIDSLRPDHHRILKMINISRNK